MRRIRTAALGAALFAAWPAAAQPPVFEVPVACRVGTDCFVQNYADVAPGPEVRDHACGSLSYDNHGGTDFRLPDLRVMRQGEGVAVLAAAAGTVARVRDGMDDVSIRSIDRSTIAGREGGNAVVIDHGDGWETQYSHLRKGSVAVRPGDKVVAGQRLGSIGLSGNTEFPHVDFAVRHDRRTLDPFLGDQTPAGCAGDKTPLWSPAAQAALAYRESALLGAAFATEPPQHAKAAEGAYADTAPTRSAPVLAFWVRIMGARAGDQLRLRILDPSGRALSDTATAAPKAYAELFLAAQANPPGGGWPPGPYRGVVSVVRNGAPVIQEERRVEIAP